MATFDYKIPPALPLPKGGNMPLFGKEGLGEIFGLCDFTYDLLSHLKSASLGDAFYGSKTKDSQCLGFTAEK